MATKLSISKEKTAELIKEFGKSDNDSGSAEVQVAILSERSPTRRTITPVVA